MIAQAGGKALSHTRGSTGTQGGAGGSRISLRAENDEHLLSAKTSSGHAMVRARLENNLPMLIIVRPQQFSFFGRINRISKKNRSTSRRAPVVGVSRPSPSLARTFRMALSFPCPV